MDMNGAKFIAILSGGMLLMFMVGHDYAIMSGKQKASPDFASLITTPSIACINTPIKGFTKPE